MAKKTKSPAKRGRRSLPPKAATSPQFDPAYLDERKALTEGAETYASRFDLWIVSLAGGALGLSMTFVKDFVRPGTKLDSCLLFLSWVLFAIAIVLCLVCTLLCQRTREKFRDDLDRAHGQPGEDWLQQARDVQTQRRLPAWINVLNYVNIGAFALGVVLLAVFMYKNL